MIKGIYSGGRYVTVNNGQPSSPTIYNNTAYGNRSSGPQDFAGQLRFNSSNGMEVFDGNTWQRIDSSVAQVSLSSEAEHLLDWVRAKMHEETVLKARMEKHPGLKDAYERFKVMDALTAEQDRGGDESEGMMVQAGP